MNGLLLIGSSGADSNHRFKRLTSLKWTYILVENITQRTFLRGENGVGREKNNLNCSLFIRSPFFARAIL